MPKLKTPSDKVLKNILFSPRQIEMINDIAEETGSDNFSGNVHYCVTQTWKKMFPTYARVADPKNIQEKFKAKAKGKEEFLKNQEQEKLQKQINYANYVMHGEVIDDVCHYTCYGPTLKNDTQEQCPLSHLGSIITEKDCFYPDMDSVFEHRPEIKKLFSK